MPQSHTAILRDVLDVSSSLVERTYQAPHSHELSNFDIEKIHLPLPKPLTSQLAELGLPPNIADLMSQIYLHSAEAFKSSAESTLRGVIAKLAIVPRHKDTMSFGKIKQKLFDAHHQSYNSALENWAQETLGLAHGWLAAVHPEPSPRCNNTLPPAPRKNCKRQFKSEYVPLFEFAFERDRFPNREDKKQLARISGMSYRQVCIWFQNRRCRHASRAKSQRLTQPPQTLEEMKERLGVSAREALMTTLLAPTERVTLTPDSSCASIPAVGGPTLPLTCDAREKVTLPRPKERTASLGVPEVSEASLDCEESDGLEEEDDEILNDPAQLTRLSSTYSPELPPRPTNPLSPSKTPTANVFPAVYKPSKPTSDPFVVRCEPWLRSTRGPQTRNPIDPSPEALEDIIGVFDSMELDVLGSNSNYSSKSTAAHDGSRGRFDMTPLHMSTAVPPNSHTVLARRTFSSSSSSSSASSTLWSSDDSAPLSRSSSYSTAPSSVVSSPKLPEISLLPPSDCAVEDFSGYTPSSSLGPRPSTDEESACDPPAGGRGHNGRNVPRTIHEAGIKSTLKRVDVGSFDTTRKGRCYGQMRTATCRRSRSFS